MIDDDRNVVGYPHDTDDDEEFQNMTYVALLFQEWWGFSRAHFLLIALSSLLWSAGHGWVTGTPWSTQ